METSNGILRSNSFIHKVTVPMEELDEAGCYTIYLCKLHERKPYFTTAEEPVAKTYTFRPVKDEGARAYHIADAHNSPVVIGAERVQDKDRVYFMGAGVAFMPEGIEVIFTDSLGQVKESQRI